MNLEAKITLESAAAEQSLLALRSHLNGTVAGFGRLALALVGVQSAMGALATGVRKMTSAIAEGGALLKLSRQTGESIRDLVLLQHAMRFAGISGEGLQFRLAMLQRALGGVNEQGEPTAKIFQQIGLNVASLKLMTAAQQLDAIGAAIRALPTPADQAAAAMKIFGRSGSEMLALFRNTDAFDQARAAAGGLADTLALNARRLNALTDQVTAFKARLQTAFVNLAADAAPAFDRLLRAVQNIFTTAAGEPTAFAAALTQLAHVIAGLLESFAAAAKWIERHVRLVSLLTRTVTALAAAYLTLKLADIIAQLALKARQLTINTLAYVAETRAIQANTAALAANAAARSAGALTATGAASKPMFPGLAAAGLLTGPVGITLAVASAVATALMLYESHLRRATAALVDFAKANAQSLTELRDQAAAIESVADKNKVLAKIDAEILALTVKRPPPGGNETRRQDIDMAVNKLLLLRREVEKTSDAWLNNAEATRTAAAALSELAAKSAAAAQDFAAKFSARALQSAAPEIQVRILSEQFERARKRAVLAETPDLERLFHAPGAAAEAAKKLRAHAAKAPPEQRGALAEAADKLEKEAADAEARLAKTLAFKLDIQPRGELVTRLRERAEEARREAEERKRLAKPGVTSEPEKRKEHEETAAEAVAKAERFTALAEAVEAAPPRKGSQPTPIEQAAIAFAAAEELRTRAAATAKTNAVEALALNKQADAIHAAAQTMFDAAAGLDQAQHKLEEAAAERTKIEENLKILRLRAAGREPEAEQLQREIKLRERAKELEREGFKPEKAAQIAEEESKLSEQIAARRPSPTNGRALAIYSDRLARVGGFVGPTGGPAAQHARDTAVNTKRIVEILNKLLLQNQALPLGSGEVMV